MPKELSERDKLGIEILKDLEFLVKEFDKKPIMSNFDLVLKLSEIGTKVKDLTLKF